MSRLAALALLLALVAGCTDDRTAAAAPTGDVFTKGGGFVPFYGEVKHDERIYLFGNKFRYLKFMETKQVDELNHKKFIGDGPEGMTMVVETEKDSPGMTERIVETCKSRYNLQ